MKKASTVFLKLAIIIIAIVTLIIMIRMPLTEGRAINLDLISIYSDPLIIYGYIASIPFFIALYQAFNLLGFIEQNKVFSPSSVKALRKIKYCALTLALAIVAAAVYIRIFHSTEDDPAGFIALSIIATFISAVVATAAAVFEKLLQKAVEIKSENDLTV